MCACVRARARGFFSLYIHIYLWPVSCIIFFNMYFIWRWTSAISSVVWFIRCNKTRNIISVSYYSNEFKRMDVGLPFTIPSVEDTCSRTSSRLSRVPLQCCQLLGLYSVGTARRWNHTDRGKTKYSDRNPSQRHFFPSHWFGFELRAPAKTSCLSHGAAVRALWIGVLVVWQQLVLYVSRFISEQRLRCPVT